MGTGDIITSMTLRDFIRCIDEDFPVQLQNLEGIIERISIKYPYLDKVSIALITKSFFEEIRRYLIMGKIIRIHGFMNSTKLELTRKGLKIKNSILK